tara:strand:- start:19974 stop:20609 length:636 start_codon:yes stop_codon:yes gene_type:complete
MSVYIVIGPESSGSYLITEIIANALGLADQNHNKYLHTLDNPIEDNNNSLIHVSLPDGRPRKFFESPEEIINHFLGENSKYQESEVKIIFTTRDKNVQFLSKRLRFGDGFKDAKLDINKAVKIINNMILENKYPYIIINYEAIILLGNSALIDLFDFIGVPNFLNPIDFHDANKVYFKKIYFKNIKNKIFRFLKIKSNLIISKFKYKLKSL